MSPSSDNVVAVLLAGGSALRMNGMGKIFVPLCGQPLLAHALRPFQDSPLVSSIVLVLARSDLSRGKALVQENNFTKVDTCCLGGPTRQASVRAGLATIQSATKWVLVHDAARPYLENRLIVDGLEAVKQTGAAIPGLPSRETIKQVTTDGWVTNTPTRSEMWAAQTPQVFDLELLRSAHQAASRDDATDDASLVESIGSPVRIFQGSPRNIKVTTQEDLILLRALLENAP